MAFPLRVHTTCLNLGVVLACPVRGASAWAVGHGAVPRWCRICRGAACRGFSFVEEARIEEANAVYHTVNATPDPPPCDPDQHGTAKGQ